MSGTFRRGERWVGDGQPCYVIAELGSNHDGDLDRARALIDQVAEAGADAVKLQSFTAEGLINRHLGSAGDGAPKHPAWEILQRLTVPEAWHSALLDHARSRGIAFLSSPFDSERAALLHRIGLPALKLASSEVTNLPFIREVAREAARLERPIILSTGMATLEEAERAATAIREEGLADFALLHCVSQYPTPFEAVNLRAIATLAPLAPVVGFSDHSPGVTAPLGAVALGAKIIEKHVTDDRSRPGPDHGYALEMSELAEMVTRIRELEAALGDGVKRPTPDEEKERAFSFRGVYAATSLKAGTVLTAEHLKCVRPAAALGPDDLASLIGRRLVADLAAHTAVTWEVVAP